MRNYKKYDIWHQGIEIVKSTYIIANKLPKAELFGLRSQITRSAVSIPSNIAEGTGRRSDKEFKRFLEIAIASLFELETQIIIVKELDLIPNLNTDDLNFLLDKQGKQMNRLIERLK